MNPLQQASVRRKIYYFAAILGLFTLSMFWRGTIPIPLAGKASAASFVSNRTIVNQATRFELRELDQGDPEIAGTAVRLLMTGSRGFAVSSLWLSAIEKQKRNDFHEFEILVRAITKLQPNFITPWIFQSWNIAYNVSVEMHSIGDMYFYISRGIQLLAEGERRNTYRHVDPNSGEVRMIGSPDMRYQIAFYYQNKFGVSDQVQTLRCLMQLSCIPRDERNPDRLVDQKTGEVKLDEFQKFCEKHPHLIRRLRGRERLEDVTEKNKEKLQCKTPEEVVQFLRDNFTVPDRYRSATELAEASEQFPILPPKFNEGPDEVNPTSTLGDDFSGFRAARAWFSYSLILLPPNPTFPLDEGGEPMPSSTPRPGEYDQFNYRIPRSPMLIIFRQGAPRAQTYQADLEQKEGWFDESGWEIDARVDPANQWFPGKTVIVGQGTRWSQREWEKAAQLWEEHGRRYGLVLSPSRIRDLEETVRGPGQPTGRQAFLPPDPTPDQQNDPAFMRRYRAQSALFFYQQNRTVTNFPYYLASAEAEAKPETVQARKILWLADQARRVGNRNEAVKLYQDGFELWKKVLIDNPSFHRQEMNNRTEEDTYEYELDYIRLLVRVSPPELEQVVNRLGRGYQAVIPFLPDPFPASGRQWNPDVLEALKWEAAEKTVSPFAGNVPVDASRTPYRGMPWVRTDIKNSVRTRQGVQLLETHTDDQP